MNYYKVIDNFLPQSEYNEIKETICSQTEFPWYWHKHQNVIYKDSFYFSHLLYSNNKEWSPYFKTVAKPILDSLEADVYINVRVNLMVNSCGKAWCGKHTDAWTKDHIHTTAIMYFGTNNGKTVLCLDNEEIEIDSIDNRVLVFDSKIVHYVKPQTDTDRRIVINLNYI